MNGDAHRVTAGHDGDGRDLGQVQAARRYDYLLGGKDHFGADRTSGDVLRAAFPSLADAVQQNRKFVRRAVCYLAELGIDQFLDIGSGLPESPNVHEIAQRINPHARVVYVDSDPVVAVHGRALLASGPPGRSMFCEADLTQPGLLLERVRDLNVLDFTRPIGVLLMAVLHFIGDTDQPQHLVNRLIQDLAPGSYLGLSHVTFDPIPTDIAERLKQELADTATHGEFHPRTRHQVTALLEGTTLVDPGVVSVLHWQPHLDPAPDPTLTPAKVAWYAAVGRVR